MPDPRFAASRRWPVRSAAVLLLAPAILASCRSLEPAAAPAGTAFLPAITPYPQTEAFPRRARVVPWWQERFDACNAQAAAGGFDILFIGDSITQGWGTEGREVWEKEIAPLGAANFGFSGDRTENVLWRLDHGNLEGRIAPRAVVVMIGTNNTGHGMDLPEEIAQGVSAIVGRLTDRLPRARVLLLGIFPRGEKPDDPMRVNNAAANALIARLDGAGGGRVKFLDLGPRFLAPDGALPQEIMPDRLHLSPRGYAIWAEAILPELRAILASPGR